MPEKWTGEVAALMHLNRITGRRLAEELGYTEEYVSKVMNGSRSPAGAEQRFKDAVNSIICKKNVTQSDIEKGECGS